MREGSLSVGIVGCGTAGPAAALFLARAGHRVTIFEQVSDPQAVGAGLILQPTGLTVLHRLELCAPILEAGAPIRHLFGTNRRGRVVMDLPYRGLREDLFGLGVHRGVLFRTLLDAVRDNAVELRFGVRIVESFLDGARRRLRDEGGNEHGPFDLVVVADGARSLLRGTTRLAKRSRPFRWAALWAVVPDPEGAFGDRLFQVYDGTRRFVGFLPTGRLETGGDSLVSFFWSIRADMLDDWRAAGMDPWKEEVLRITSAAEPVLAQLKSCDDLIFAPYQDAIMRCWHEDAILYIGDAAHPMSPQLGQGVNLALFDAMVLADCLASEPTMPAAFDRYTRLRRGPVNFYQRFSRWLLPLFQSDYSFLAPARDWLVHPGSRIPGIHHLALATMAGIKTGLWGEMSLEDVTPYLTGVGDGEGE